MKKLLVGIIAFFSVTLNAQNMEIIAVNQMLTKLYIATDNKDWEGLEAIFADKVLLDYSSFGAGEPVILTPQQIIGSWKGMLPGFKFTHHQLGNFITKVNGNKAEVFCYGTATHYLEHNEGNIWTVVGSYNLELKKEKEIWKVNSMKFNFKYQDGNTKLPEKAMQIVKKSPKR
jgi:hypothetical protein